MSFGAMIRFIIVAGWATFFIFHIVKHAAPGLGLTERNAFATALAANLGRTYVYKLQRTVATKPQRIGECTMSFQRSENGFELETIVHLDDLALLAPGINLIPSLSDKSSRQMHVSMTELLDTKRRLVGLKGSGNILGLEATGEGIVTEIGLTGTYTVDDGTPTAFTRPDIKSDVSNGNDFAVTLPPGLVPGDRFTSRMVSPDFTSLKLNAVTAIYSVEPHESVTTVAGQLSLLRVLMQVDNRTVATLWCDNNGTVYRSRQQDGMELALITIREIGGRVLWPRSISFAP
jgi:hypothetical protein